MRCIHKLPNSGTGGTQCPAKAMSGSVLCTPHKTQGLAAVKLKTPVPETADKRAVIIPGEAQPT